MKDIDETERIETCQKWTAKFHIRGANANFEAIETLV
jgi:hypothetical protein